MAEEIKLVADFWPSVVNNPNSYEDIWDQTNDLFLPRGLVFPDSLCSEIYFCCREPIPADVNAVPAGKLWIGWLTLSTDVALVVEWDWALTAFNPATPDSWDPAAWGITGAPTQASAGASKENTCVCSLAAYAASLVAGRVIAGRIKRDATPGHATDTLTSSAMIDSIIFVADKT